MDDRKPKVVPGIIGRRLTTGSHAANSGMNGFSESTHLLSENGRSELGLLHTQMRNGEKKQVNGSLVPANHIIPKQIPGSAEDRAYHKGESAAELVAFFWKSLREKETSHRPLRYDRPRIKNHQPIKVLAERFEKHVNDELERHRLNTFPTKKWLRISTWWLLKVPIHSVLLFLRAALIRKLRQSTPGRIAKDSSQQMLPSLYPSTESRQ